MAEPLLRCAVASRRRAAGLSLTALAARIGVSRQALTAVEAGRSTPSTAVALRLAQALDCAVEDLFTLANPTLDILSDGAVGSRVVVGRVGDVWVSHGISRQAAGPADGLVASDGVELFGALESHADTVLVAGCAPVLGALSGHLEQTRQGARWLQMSSGVALQALAEGRTHVAGLHLAAHDDPDAHETLVRAAIPGAELDIVQLVGWREGFAVAPTNPHGIRSVADVVGLRVARRGAGAGAERALRQACTASGIDPMRLEGPAVRSHFDAAMAVRHGAADAAVLVEPIADAFGLPFLPLSEERFELVVRSRDRRHPGVVRLLERLADARFGREVRAMGAYDTRDMGVVRTMAAG